MKKSNGGKRNNNLLINLTILLGMIIFLGAFTYVLAILVSTPNSILGKFAIEKFQQTNDWIGFGGYILTSIISITVLFITIYQTREIQKQNTQIQELDRRNNIKPRIDIDMPWGVMIKYEINESEQKVNIVDVSIDSSTNFSKDLNTKVCNSLLKVLNLSPNAMAKSLNIKIHTNLDDIKRNLGSMKMIVKEKSEPYHLEINNKKEAICILTKDIVDSREIEYDKSYRFLSGNGEIILDLDVYLFIIKDLVEILLYGYISSTTKEKIDEITGFTINNKKIIDLFIDIECEDIEFFKYKSRYRIDVIANSANWKNNEVLIQFKIVDIKRDNNIKK